MAWSEKTWFSPCYAINELGRKFRSFGGSIHDRKYQKLREAWVGSLVAMALSIEFDCTYWVQVPKNDPPDILCMTLKKNGLGNEDIVYLPVEVFEIDPNAVGIVEAIDKKISGHDYSGMCVVGYVRKEGNYDLNELSKIVISKKYNVHSIAILASDDRNTHVNYVQLSPIGAKASFDYEAMCSRSDQRDFLEVKRSTLSEYKEFTTQEAPDLIPN